MPGHKDHRKPSSHIQHIFLMLVCFLGQTHRLLIKMFSYLCLSFFSKTLTHLKLVPWVTPLSGEHLENQEESQILCSPAYSI